MVLKTGKTIHVPHPQAWYWKEKICSKLDLHTGMIPVCDSENSKTIPTVLSGCHSKRMKNKFLRKKTPFCFRRIPLSDSPLQISSDGGCAG